MKLELYPRHLLPDSEGDVTTFIRKGLSKRKDLRLKVETFLDHIKNTNSLDFFERSEQISNLSGGLYEMRIPKQDRKGVVRIYFCYHPGTENALILLCAELKHKKEGLCIPEARKRLKSVCEFYRGRS